MGRQAQAKVHTTPDGQAPQGWAEGGYHASILFAGGSGLGSSSPAGLPHSPPPGKQPLRGVVSESGWGRTPLTQVPESLQKKKTSFLPLPPEILALCSPRSGPFGKLRQSAPLFF